MSSPTAPANEAPAPKRRLSIGRIVLFVMMPMMLVIGAAGGIFITGMLAPKAPVKVEEKPREPRLQPIFFAIDDIVQTIRDPDGRSRFLVMNLSVEVDQPTDSDLLKLRAQKLRDVVVTRMSKASFSELSNSAQVEELRLDILAKLKEVAGKAKILDLSIVRMRLQ